MKTKEQREPTVTITLRVPEWLHDGVRDAAFDHRMSMNEYCQQLLAKSIKKGLPDVAQLNPARENQARRA